MTTEQITGREYDERFYAREVGGETVYAPSWTHVLSTVWPKSPQLEKWLGDVGTERAAQIMEEAGAVGTYVHGAIEEMLKGEVVQADEVRDRFPGTKALKPLKCLAAFVDFHNQFNLVPTRTEFTTWLPTVAGTVDFMGFFDKPVKKGNRIQAGEERVHGIIDWKTSTSVHDTHQAQVAGYYESERSVGEVDCACILHLGNNTKRGWSLVVVDLDKWVDLAFHAVKTFHLHFPNARPHIDIFPNAFAVEPRR